MRFTIVLFLSVLVSCDKLVELPPNNSLIQTSDLKKDDKLLTAYCSSIYNDLYHIHSRTTANTPLENLTYFGGLLSDEFKANLAISNQNIRNSYNNQYYEGDGSRYLLLDLFVAYYKIIVSCNNILALLERRPEGYFRDQFYEAKAIRGIMYYLLTELYGDIPLLLSSDVNDNLKIPKSNRTQIIQFCIDELIDAHQHLGNQRRQLDFSQSVNGYTERINKDVVSYYLTLLYLLSGDYRDAIEHALAVVANYDFNGDYTSKFEKTSTENVWILEPSFPALGNHNNNPSAAFLNYKLVPSGIPFNSGTRLFSMSDRLVRLFDTNDKRRKHFVDSVYYNNRWEYLPYKYKVVGLLDINAKERFVIIRLPAVYLNLIEAYYRNGDQEKALEYFNILGRNNYEDYVDARAIDLETIVDERFKELFAENGDRWFTLKRTGLLDQVMSKALPVKSNGEFQWNPAKMTYLPIPLQQQLLNPYLK